MSAFVTAIRFNKSELHFVSAVGAEATLADAQARYAKKQASLRLFERAGWEATRNAMHTIIVHLTKRTEHMSALVSLRKQVRLLPIPPPGDGRATVLTVYYNTAFA